MQITLGQPFSFCQVGQRPHQEDARFPDSDSPLAPKPFFMVCDGVGGSERGEVASRTVCRSMARTLGEFDWSGEFTMHDFGIALGKAYKALDRIADEENADMATTLVLAAFHEGGCTMAHIGDSRAYHFRPSAGTLYRSADHSMVDSLVHAGIVSPDGASDHPQSTTITRFMEPTGDEGECSSATVCQTTDLQAGDYIFLCSDGVLSQVDDDLLAEIICGESEDEEKMQLLSELCSQSQDNNTAILIPVIAVSDIQDDDDEEACDNGGNITQRMSGSRFRIQDVSPKEESYFDRFCSFVDKIFN